MIQIPVLFYIFLLLLASCTGNTTVLNVDKRESCSQTNLTQTDPACASNSGLLLDAPDMVQPKEEFEISWNQISGAVEYEAIIANDKNCLRPILSQRIVETQLTLSLIAIGDYFLCVSAVLGNGSTIPAQNQGLQISVKLNAGNSPTPSPSPSATPAVQFKWLTTISDFAAAEDSALADVKAQATGGSAVSYSLDTNISTCDDGSWSPTLAIDSATGELSGTPTNDDVGDCTVKIVATSDSQTIDQTFVITVTNTNDLPSWDTLIDDFTLEVGVAITGKSVAANDVDSADTAIFSLDTANMTCDDGSWAVAPTIDSSTGEISGTPSASDDGICTFAILATSGGDSIGTSFSIHIYPSPSAFTWSGNGGDDNWSTAGNWHGGASPSTSDVALFTAFCGLTCPVNVDVAIDIAGISLHESYAGAVTQQNGVSIELGSGGFVQHGGSFVGGDALFDINGGKLQISRGSYQATSGTTAMYKHGGTSTNHEFIEIGSDANFDANTGTFNLLIGSGTCSISNFNIGTDSSIEFNDLILRSQVNGCSKPTFRVIPGKVAILGALDFVKGRLSGNWELYGDLTVRGTAQDAPTAALVFKGNVDQTYTFEAGARLTNVTVDKAAGIVKPGIGTANIILGKLEIISGTFWAPSGSLTITTVSSASATLDLMVVGINGNFDHGGGEVVFAPSSGTCTYQLYNIDVVSTSFQDVRVNKQDNGCSNPLITVTNSDSVTIEGSLTVDNGAIQGRWNLIGDYVSGASADGGAAELVFEGVNHQVTDNGGFTPDGNWFINGATVTLLSNLTVDAAGQEVIVDGGTLDRNGFTITGTVSTINGGQVIN